MTRPLTGDQDDENKTRPALIEPAVMVYDVPGADQAHIRAYRDGRLVILIDPSIPPEDRDWVVADICKQVDHATDGRDHLAPNLCRHVRPPRLRLLRGGLDGPES